jgi:hypothetical protein
MHASLVRVAATVAVVLVIGPAATATAGAWRAGTNVFVREEDAIKDLEISYDHAFCTGIPRFGHTGAFPYERFVYFDCDTMKSGQYCTDRVRAVRTATPGRFRLLWVGRPSCY